MHIWCMRFEARHERLKRLASVIGNFTNIPWTLANLQVQQYNKLTCSKNVQSFIEKPKHVESSQLVPNAFKDVGFLAVLQILSLNIYRYYHYRYH